MLAKQPVGLGIERAYGTTYALACGWESRCGGRVGVLCWRGLIMKRGMTTRRKKFTSRAKNFSKWFLLILCFEYYRLVTRVSSNQMMGYCWPTSFKVLGVLFLREVFPTFLPSTKACWTHRLRHFGVDQQYLMVLQDFSYHFSLNSRMTSSGERFR